MKASTTAEQLQMMGDWEEEDRELLVDDEWLDWFIHAPDDPADIDMSNRALRGLRHRRDSELRVATILGS